MKYYLFIVEGAHDVAVITKILKMLGVNKTHTKYDNLPDVWKKLIPNKFPFFERLDEPCPAPRIIENGQVSIAIKNAGGDSRLLPELIKIIKILSIKDLNLLEGIMVLGDADDKTATDKLKELISNLKSEEKKCIEFNQDIISVEKNPNFRKIDVQTYVFPNNNDSGDLEDLILESGEVAYSELLTGIKDYIKTIDSEIYTQMKKEVAKKKTLIGCVGNVLRPGKANQVSLYEDNWICTESLEQRKALYILHTKIKKFIGLIDTSFPNV